MLKKITLDYVGPAKHMEVDFADRLTVITGDNSLGKSLLLDVAFFCCTRDWPGEVAIPLRGWSKGAKISVSGVTDNAEKKNHKYYGEFLFSPGIRKWDGGPPVDLHRSGNDEYIDLRSITKNSPGITLYSRVDGSFSVYDPERALLWRSTQTDWSFRITKDQVWLGAETASGISYCRGIVQDWIDWRNRRSDIFSQFRDVFDILRDNGDGFSFNGDTIRLPGGDVTDWPVIETPYGSVAVIHISEAVKRIIALSYMIIWTIHEHKLAVEANEAKPNKHLIVILDEIEAHLHPTWQRLILPALLAVSDEIEGFTVQFIVTTHSPLVLAGLEPTFDETRDKILHLKREGADVSLETLPFRPYGTASEWLMSPVFGLEEARNLPAQTILRQARDLMRQPKSEATEQQAKALEPDLRHLIPSIDPFWTGWHFFWHGLPGQKNDSA
jgi:hypothetical protein